VFPLDHQVQLCFYENWFPLRSFTLVIKCFNYNSL
jgi:hypothetical protein